MALVLLLQSQKLKLEQQKEKAKAEIAFLKAQPLYPDVNQLIELLVAELKTLQWELPADNNQQPQDAEEEEETESDSEAAEEEETESDSEDDHDNPADSMIEEQKRIKESLKADLAKQQVEKVKNELVDLMGINVVTQYYNKKLMYDKYRDKMLKIRKSSKITNCNVITKKGHIIPKVYREDGTNEVISNFKMGTFRETLAEGNEGALHLGPERARVYSDLSPKDKDRMQLNSKFVNNMLSEWGRFVTAVKLNKGAAGYGGAQNRVGNANPGQARQIKCYNCNAQENRVALDEEQLLFIAGGQDNVVDEDMDEQPVQNLALNVDSVFQAGDYDAFDYDVDEALTIQTMFMVNLSSAYPVYDEASPSYDSDILSEVPDHDNYQIMHKGNEAISSSNSLLSGGSSTVPICLSEEYEDPCEEVMKIFNHFQEYSQKAIFTHEEPGALYRHYQLKAN
ncbi:hypothetical protein Tco_1294660 [Tanacetum coccineum]